MDANTRQFIFLVLIWKFFRSRYTRPALRDSTQQVILGYQTVRKRIDAFGFFAISRNRYPHMTVNYYIPSPRRSAQRVNEKPATIGIVQHDVIVPNLEQLTLN